MIASAETAIAVAAFERLCSSVFPVTRHRHQVKLIFVSVFVSVFISVFVSVFVSVFLSVFLSSPTINEEEEGCVREEGFLRFTAHLFHPSLSLCRTKQ